MIPWYAARADYHPKREKVESETFSAAKIRERALQEFEITYTIEITEFFQAHRAMLICRQLLAHLDGCLERAPRFTDRRKSKW